MNIKEYGIYYAKVYFEEDESKYSIRPICVTKLINQDKVQACKITKNLNTRVVHYNLKDQEGTGLKYKSALELKHIYIINTKNIISNIGKLSITDRLNLDRLFKRFNSPKSVNQLYLDESLDESLHGFNQIQEFLNLCDAMGMKTIDDIQRFMEEHPGEDVMKALQDFRRELGPKFKIANKERGLYGAKKTSVFNDYINPELDPNSFENSKWMDFDDDIDESLIEGLNKSFEEDLNNNFKPNIQSSTNSFSPASKSSVLEDIRKNIQFINPESQVNNLNNNSNTILDVANPDMVYDDEI